MIDVYLPMALRELTGNALVVSARGATIGELIDDLERQYPGLRARLRTDQGLRPGLAAVINGNVGGLGLWQPLPDTCEVHFLPAIAGG